MSRERDYGGEVGGGLNAQTKAYKADPTIETYVRLRRGDPDAEIEVRTIGSFESMFYMREEFERYGLDPDLLGDILDADHEAIGEASLRIMELMIEARQRTANGDTHLASRGEVIPDKLIDWIITCALDALSWNDVLFIPRDLIVLVRERLGGSSPHYEEVGRIRSSKMDAAVLAGQLRAMGIKPTLKVLAQVFRVSPSTIMRWFEEGELKREAERWSRTFDENGKPRPL